MLFFQTFQTVFVGQLVTHSTGKRRIGSGVNRPGLEADFSPLSVFDIKNS
jgi:hypothetical protein